MRYRVIQAVLADAHRLQAPAALRHGTLVVGAFVAEALTTSAAMVDSQFLIKHGTAFMTMLNSEKIISLILRLLKAHICCDMKEL